MRTLYISSLLIALLIATVSILGLMFQEILYPAEELLHTFVPNDILNLVAGLPFLLISIWLSSRGKMMGLLCWPGALFYIVYVYFPYIICIPFNFLFLPYLVVFALSIYTLIGVVAGMDSGSISKRFAGKVPARTFGGILMGLGVLIIVRQVILMVSALINETVIDQQELALWIDDISVGAPAMLLGGLLLWKKKPLGYVLAPGLFVVYAILSLGLVPYMIVQAKLKGTEILAVDIVVLIIMAIICFIPFAFFIRASGNYKAKPK